LDSRALHFLETPMMTDADYIPLSRWLVDNDVTVAQLMQAERRGIHLPIDDGAAGSVWVWSDATADFLMMLHLHGIRPMPKSLESFPPGPFLSPDPTEAARRQDRVEEVASP
jgi:hypothetical protein